MNDNLKTFVGNHNQKVFNDPNYKGQSLIEDSNFNDVFYTDSVAKSITQTITNQMNSNNLIPKIWLKETWNNGLITNMYSKYLPIFEYSQEVTIADFNAEVPKLEEETFKIDFRKYSKIYIPPTSGVSIFEDKQLGEGLDSILSGRLADAINIFEYEEMDKILQESGTDNQIVWDKIYNVNGMSNDQILNLIRKVSNEMVKPNTIYKTYQTATPLSKQHIAFNNSFINDELNTSTYPLSNIKDSINGISNEIVNINDNKVKAILSEVGALRLGSQVKGEWQFKTPKLGNIFEFHYWFGFARFTNKILIKFVDIDPISL